MKPFATNPFTTALAVVITLRLLGWNRLDRTARNWSIPNGMTIVFRSILLMSAASKWFKSGNFTVIDTRNYLNALCAGPLHLAS